ncbi:MAG: hypothetical protein JW928_02790, partial [Candidatus Aureabacteria bacterium]|nr:hypothetical protein [Candidatus Auribacterota bacterium]
MDIQTKDSEIFQQLIDKGLLSSEETSRVRRLLEEGSYSLPTVIFKNSFERKIDILDIISQEYSVPCIDLHQVDPDLDILKKIPARYAIHYNCFPFKEEDGILHVAIENP